MRRPRRGGGEGAHPGGVGSGVGGLGIGAARRGLTVAKMLGRAQWWNAGCACCRGPRARKSQRRRGERAWRQDVLTQHDGPQVTRGPSLARLLG